MTPAVGVRIDDLPARRPPVPAAMRGPSFEALDRPLRRVLSDREWRVYLDLEAVVNARLAYALAVVVPWAFAQGATRASKEGA